MAEEKKPKTDPPSSPKEGISWQEVWQRFSQNRLVSILSVVLVVAVVGWVAYRQYLASQNEECLKEMRAAEAFFRQDSFEKAIKGTATVMGFEQLVNDYGSTQAGNLCRLYLGLCYLKTGKPQAAIETLEDYDAPDSYLGGAALAALAGAYAEVKAFEKAARYYEKAAKIHNNSQTSPPLLLQAGLCYELASQWDKAAEVYARITEKYPLAAEAPTAQKHLARVQAHVD